MHPGLFRQTSNTIQKIQRARTPASWTQQLTKPHRYSTTARHKMDPASVVDVNKPKYPPLHIVHPTKSHKQTILMIHGLGSSGPIFEQAFFASKTSQHFRDRFPHARWVFPSAPLRHVQRWNDTRPAWFNIASFTDLEKDQQVQMEGLRQSVAYLGRCIDDEVARLDESGRSAKDLVVIARSQGSSAMVWTLLSTLKQSIGGVVLTGSWLVFARALTLWMDDNGADDATGTCVGNNIAPGVDASGFVSSVLQEKKDLLLRGEHPLQLTSILMGHCTTDEWINVSLGRQMRDTLKRVGCNVVWNKYEHAADEGHWLAEPDEFNAIADFMEMRLEAPR